jgi:two-component system, OmpR family, phosphate regulon sensor histidine kinase PhoR
VSSLRQQSFLFPPVLVAVALAVINFYIYRLLGYLPASILAMSVVLLVVTATLSYWNANRLLKPLLDLMPQADGVAKGRLEVSNHGTREIPEEIQGLANAIEKIGEKQARDFAAMQKLERVRSEFLGNVSHELRTPIFAVQGFIETLLDGAIDDPAVNRDFLERAHLQAARLNNLLSDLIDISRIESGEMRMSYRFFDVVHFLREVIREMEPVAALKDTSIRFVTQVGHDAELDIFGDKERIKQVMVNLVDNAIKYGDSPEPVVVELRNNTPDPDMVTISVTDHGRGIASEHLPRLFERFYRVDKDRSRANVGGTGLGLAICKHIIEAHHSKIQVTSQVGQGSTFTFTLHKRPFET